MGALMRHHGGAEPPPKAPAAASRPELVRALSALHAGCVAVYLGERGATARYRIAMAEAAEILMREVR